MVFKQELEYRRLKRCPLCGKKGRRTEAQRREEQSSVGTTKTLAAVNTTTIVLANWDRDTTTICARAVQLICCALV